MFTQEDTVSQITLEMLAEMKQRIEADIDTKENEINDLRLELSEIEGKLAHAQDSAVSYGTDCNGGQK